MTFFPRLLSTLSVRSWSMWHNRTVFNAFPKESLNDINVPVTFWTDKCVSDVRPWNGRIWIMLHKYVSPIIFYKTSNQQMFTKGLPFACHHAYDRNIEMKKKKNARSLLPRNFRLGGNQNQNIWDRALKFTVFIFGFPQEVLQGHADLPLS